MKKLGSQIIDFKRMIRQYEFFIEDLNDLKEIQSNINSDFSSAIAGLKRPDLFDSKVTSDAAEQANQAKDSEEEPERDPSFKKLFRKMVVKCHPDRLSPDTSDSERLRLKQLYESSIKANDDYNWALLITTAIKLEIELGEEYYDHVNELKHESDKVQKEIEGIQGSVAWTWYHASEEEKPKIMQQYVKHMEKSLGLDRKKVLILGVGHPRTGTGFTASILSSWGLRIGHEKLMEDGIVAWQHVIENGPWPWIKHTDKLKPEILIYNVRNPKDSIPSIVFTEDVRPESLKFRIRRGRVSRSSNPVEQAIHSILRWDELIIKMGPKFTYRVEDQAIDLFNFLKDKNLNVKWVSPQSVVNDRKHQGFESLKNELQSVSSELQKKMNAYCQKYGYDPVFLNVPEA